MINNFKKFNLDKNLIDKLNERRITEPTEIQNEVIPKIFNGDDIIAQSKSGTGKTLSYLLPLIQMIIDKRSSKVMIVSPTKELARQIYNEALYYTYGLNIKTLLISGGDDLQLQKKKLNESFNILIGVPGRILKHIDSGFIKPSTINKIVFDEADFLIDFGFLDDLTKILDSSKHVDQIIILSATLSKNTKKIIDIVNNQKFTARVETKNRLPEKIINYFFSIKDEDREKILLKIINAINPYLCIIFVRTKDICNYLYKFLKANKIKVGYLSGDLSPSLRKKEIKNFKNGRYQYLVATDLASRGLDIEGITHIINYNMTVNELDYLHRAGRTGRINESGTVYSLCNELDEGYLKKYAYYLDFKLQPVKFKNDEIIVDEKYTGVKPRFNLKDLKSIENKKKSHKKETKSNAVKKRRNKKRR
jgi:ATP-dependent RNA helicase DeaD